MISLLLRGVTRASLALVAFSSLLVAQSTAHGPAFDAAASDARRFELAPGLKLTTWAAEPLLANGVAFSFDGLGRCYVAESHRWAISVFDITQHTNWLIQDMSFRTVADRSAFLLHQFATNTTLLTHDSEIVRRVEDRSGSGRADHSEIVADHFNSEVDGTAAGVLAQGTNVWLANIPNLWRIPIGDRRSEMEDRGKVPVGGGNGGTNSRVAIGSGFGVHIGVSGHDLHGLIRGPDGRIYMSFGDRGVCLTNREGIRINLPDTGGVLRCETDGSNLEVFCFGLRNPQELAFDDLGNLWTVDNDTAGADPCRVLHLVHHGDYGWRTSYQHMEGFGPWVQEELWKGGQDGILPPAGTVSQGPSGLAFYPGTGFGDRLKNTFLHCDFPAGVIAFTVKPSGSSYVVDRKERFLWNVWATDVDFGPDGAAYILDWVTGWGRPMKGRIQRITSITLAPAEIALIAEVKRLLGEGMQGRNEADLLTLLGHADRRIRLEAQWELADRGIKSLPGLAATAHAPGPFLQRAHALWAVGQLARQSPDRGIEWELPLLRVLDIVVGADRNLAVEAALVLDEAGNAEELRHVDRLRELQSDPDLSVRRRVGAVASALPFGKTFRPLPRRVDQLASTATRLNQPWIATLLNQCFPRVFKADPEPIANVERILASTPPDPFLDHVAREVLIGAAGLEDLHNRHLAQAATNASPDVRRIALLAYRRLGEFGGLGNRWPGFDTYPASAVALSPQITNFLSDPEPRLVIAAGRAIHDVPISAGFPALAAFITKVDCPTNLMSRAIDAAFRLGSQQHAQMLANFAKRRDVPEWARSQALDALADWERPKPLDRVIGLWRPLLATRNAGTNAGTLPADLGRSASYEEAMALKRNVQPAKRAFLRVADEILDPSTPDENGIVVGGPPAPALVQLAVIDTAVRLGTREASTPLFQRFTQTNTPPEVRRAIVGALAELKAAQSAEALRQALADPDPAMRSAAVPYLDRLEGADALGILRSLIQDAAIEPGKPQRPSAGTLRLAQSAFKALRAQTGEDADALARAAFQRMQRGELPTELELDILTAADGRSDPQLRSALAERFNAGQVGAPIARWRATRFGGDASRGRDIFFNHPAVQCSRCHQAWGAGGTVGPKLDGVGKRLTRDDILESVVAPNAKIAAGFETAVLTLKDGRTLTGRVKNETSDSLILETTDGETGAPVEQPIEVSKITERERGLSPMPEGLATMLTPFEMRDLVEFLANLK